MVHAEGDPCCHEEDLLSVCGDGGFTLCTLIAQCTTGVQPPPAPGPNQSDWGQERLFNQLSSTRHSHITMFYISLADIVSLCVIVES